MIPGDQPADIVIALDVDEPISVPQGFNGLEFAVNKESGKVCSKILTFEKDKNDPKAAKNSRIKIEMKISED
jgi:hypothetical protein